jgi:hypothetical protein
MLSPFLGLPVSWLAWILPILGIIAAVIGYSLRSEKVEQQRARQTALNEVVPSESLA